MTGFGLLKDCLKKIPGRATSETASMQPSPMQPERRRIDEALLGLAADDQAPVFVDFDYTLFACNSTELFIASCKPSFLVAILDFVVRQCVPWRLTGLANWFRLRDFACCVLILLLCPWNLLIWRRAAPDLFERYKSPEVAEAIRRIDPRQTVIVSFGMAMIIEPLLRGTAWQASRLIATPVLKGPGYLLRGKLALVLKSFSAQTVAESTFITDSLDDADLLRAARLGILIEPQGEAFGAAEHLYMPLRYTARVKYTLSYVVDQIVLVELLSAVIATASDLHALRSAMLVVPFLTISLMCVYEIGYFENDMVGAKLEAKPRLGTLVGRFRSYPIEPAAWMWAVLLGVLGCLSACLVGTLAYANLTAVALVWIAALVSLRVLFFLYNRASVHTRLLVYPVLQTMKYVPIFLVVRPTQVGAFLATSQVATMWVLYLTYRAGGSYQRAVEKEVFRTILFSVGLCLAATGGSVAELGGVFPITTIYVWSLARLIKAPVLKLLRRRDLRAVQAT